ncbi:uracil-DNA glycosylase family protein [Mycobacterium kyogaense]|uniref:uracil-DNA glycosylase family protein n=1 Tax=Mycobacterium kyogaense TaxID=2212479 RepID=UPI000DAEAA5B|nr:uracil-DNA glycosylase family protein [Mycobacterium kyogaense]
MMEATPQRNRREDKARLDDEIRSCTRCAELNVPGKTQAAPGWGDIDSPVAIVGQSLCDQCMEPQEPFFEGSGSLLNQAFSAADHPKSQMFVTNAVHCHPPGNRKSELHEIVNCAPYLYRELQIVQPRLVIGLGEDAERVLTFFYPTARVLPWPFATPRNVRSKVVPCLFFAKHPSWIKRKHNADLETEYVRSLADAFKWAFSRGSLRTADPATSVPAEKEE